VQTRGNILEFIENVFGPTKLTNAGLNASVVCPKCNAESLLGTNKKKLVIRTDDFRCHCWVCGFKGRTILRLLKDYHPEAVHEFIDQFGTMFVVDMDTNDHLSIPFIIQRILEQDEVLLPSPNKPISLPKGFMLLAPQWSSEKGHVGQANRYLYRRGLDLEDLWLYKIGISTQNNDHINRVIFPSYDSYGKLNFHSSRTIYGARPKYIDAETPKENIVFNEINIDWNKELIVVEGPFDMVKCPENVTCLLGSDLTTNYTLFQRIVENNTPVVLGLDNDAKKKTFNILKLLLEHQVSTRLMTPPSHVNDVGELTKVQVKHLYEDAETVSHKTLLKLKLLG
jgi:hypothetical protein